MTQSTNRFLDPMRYDFFISAISLSPATADFAEKSKGIPGPYKLCPEMDARDGSLTYAHLSFPYVLARLIPRGSWTMMHLYSKKDFKTPMCNFLFKGDLASIRNAAVITCNSNRPVGAVTITFDRPADIVKLFDWLVHPHNPYCSTTFTICAAGSEQSRELDRFLKTSLVGCWVDTTQSIMRKLTDPDNFYMTRRFSDGMYIYSLHLGATVLEFTHRLKNNLLATSGRIAFDGHYLEFAQNKWSARPLFCITHLDRPEFIRQHGVREEDLVGVYHPMFPGQVARNFQSDIVCDMSRLNEEGEDEQGTRWSTVYFNISEGLTVKVKLCENIENQVFIGNCGRGFAEVVGTQYHVYDYTTVNFRCCRIDWSRSEEMNDLSSPTREELLSMTWNIEDMEMYPALVKSPHVYSTPEALFCTFTNIFAFWHLIFNELPRLDNQEERAAFLEFAEDRRVIRNWQVMFLRMQMMGARTQRVGFLQYRIDQRNFTLCSAFPEGFHRLFRDLYRPHLQTWLQEYSSAFGVPLPSPLEEGGTHNNMDHIFNHISGIDSEGDGEDMAVDD